MTDGIDTPVYLDHHATTPVDERVVEAMEPYFTELYGNPSSNNDFSRRANDAVDNAKEQVANAINADPREILFTSGATESDNLALRGVIEHAQKNGEGNHLITAATEHEAVLNLAHHLESEGVEVTVLPVDETGRIDPTTVENAIREDTVMVSIMAANNEIGTIAPLGEIGTVTDEKEVLFHTDAVQAVGYLDLDVEDAGVDMMSISGHKIYGPKGIGALYISKRNPKVKLEPLLHGGGQQDDLRPGTIPVPNVVGLGEAVKLAEDERDERTTKLRQLRDELWEELNDKIDKVDLNGHPNQRLPNSLNVSIHEVTNQRLVTKLDDESDVIIASGSACSSFTEGTQTSHVLEALTNDEERHESAVRIGLGKDTTEEEIEYAAQEIENAVSRLRRLNF